MTSSNIGRLAVFVPMLAALAPEAAQAGSPYVGIEAGVARGRDNDVDILVDYSATQTTAVPFAPAVPIGAEFDDALSVAYRSGYDIGIAGGYDFGPFRFELELARKSVGVREVEPDENFGNLPALTVSDFELDGNMRVGSAMINGLFDLELTSRLTMFGGGGHGRSWARGLGDDDGAWAWQYMFGVRYSISDRVELGLMHRYFNSGILKLRHRPLAHSGNPQRLVTGEPGLEAAVDGTVNAMTTAEIEGEFRVRSLLVSLHFNL